MNNQYYIVLGSNKAVGEFLGKEMKVLKGSIISSTNKSSFRKVEERNANIEKYAEMQGNLLVVKEDVVFSTPSAAAVFCTGRNTNGWLEWKNSDGIALDIIERRSRD